VCLVVLSPCVVFAVPGVGNAPLADAVVPLFSRIIAVAELNDTSAKAIMKFVHQSHQNSLADGRHQLGVPASVPVTKTLTPRQIIELRQRRNRHLVRANSVRCE